MRPATKLTGQEPVKTTDLDLPNATMLDFWQWGFSDLRVNNLRGVFAEWLVAKILSIDTTAGMRESWASWDITAPGDVRIEVKAAAYLQAWHQSKFSVITFSGLKARVWDEVTGLADEVTYNADLYIFCVQIWQDANSWDVLNLDQWHFYILRKRDLVAMGTRSLGLVTVAKIAKAKALTASELREVGLEMIQEIQQERRGISGVASSEPLV